MTDLDRAILDLEARMWRYAGAKEAAVRAELGLTPVRYYQRLRALMVDAEAIAYAPALTARLRARAARDRRSGALRRG